MTELKLYKRIIIHGLTGLFLGFFILHPVSMLLMSTIIDRSILTFQLLLSFFSHTHIPVACCFSFIGMTAGIIQAYYIHIIINKKTQIHNPADYLAICSHCKKIKILGRNKNKTTWIDIESYITGKSNSRLSHGICPECAITLYPELLEEIN